MQKLAKRSWKQRGRRGRSSFASGDGGAEKQQQIEELEEWAQLFGDPVKQSAQAKVLEHT